MEELIKSLGIDEGADAEEIVRKLELRQSEIMERLDNVEDDKRRQKLENDLKQIDAAIEAFSWMRGKKQTGIAREEDVVSEDFSDLKGQSAQTIPAERQLYDEALAMLETPDYEEGVEKMRNLAERGYVAAICQMGMIYFEGKYVIKDMYEAVQWYHKAALQGHAGAQYNLGIMYHNGWGVIQDFVKAAEWCKKAAGQGHADAQYNLGCIYSNGWGVVQNYAKAAEWYQKAAEQGDTAAQNILGNMYSAGEGVAQDYAKAAEWYQKAAEQGDADAQCNLGNKYKYGLGVVQDYVKAVEWYQKAAEQGNADAQCNLGIMYKNGFGVAQDYAKAAEWYQKAADQGNANAQSMLEYIYKNGKGVEKDNENERPKEQLYTAIPRQKKKSGIKRKSSKIALKTLIAVVIIFGLETFNYEVLDMGVFYYLPDITFSPIMVINDSISPYYITLVPKSHIQINRNNEDLSFVIDPFGAAYLSIDPPIKKLKIHDGTKTVDLNCEKLKELTIPDSVTKLELSHLTDELALTLELPEHLESFSISESLYLTDTGFQALEIPESVQELIIEGCDNLENIDIPNNLESLKIREAENLTVNVSGAVQRLDAVITESLTVNVSGAVQELETISERLTVNVNGAVHTLISPGSASASLPVVKSVTVNGQIDICRLGASVWDNSGKEEWESIYHVEFSEAPRALQLWCIGENELILPEGTEILRLNWDSEEIPIIPDSVRYLFINSDILDFDAVNIPESILYYELYSKERDVRRKYQDENCPEALEDFDFDGDVPDLSGIVKSGAARKQIPSDALTWNDSSYYIFKGFETWEEAEAYCESIGGHLAVIESAEENEAVYSYVREQGYSNAFFGASDAAEEGEWRWVDGSAMSYTNWHKNEPNNDKNEDYIDYYYKDGTWNDSSFKSDSNIICEWD